MSFSVNTRYAAFGVHLLISIAVLLVLLAVIFFYWFPYDLIFAGGIEGLKILLGVDLVLGPALTLIVFDRAKKSLKFDLTAIGILQVTCLAGGLWLIYNERPLTQVMADDGVHLLTKADFAVYETDYPNLNERRPHNIMLDLPTDLGELIRVATTSALLEGKPLALRSELYLPMSSQTQQQYDARITTIRTVLKDELVTEMDALPKGDCDWLPLHSIHVKGFACTTFDNGIVRLSNRSFF